MNNNHQALFLCLLYCVLRSASFLGRKRNYVSAN
jgi:hypothetical protein